MLCPFRNKIHKSLVNIILKKKLEYFGHIKRRDGGNLQKQCIEGCVAGHAGKGRPKLGGLTTFVHHKDRQCSKS